MSPEAAAESFAIGEGRARPPHQPRAIKCESCGAPLQVVDERAQTIVCQYCNTQLRLTPTEVKVLTGAGDPVDFELKVGEEVAWKGKKYVVVGRIALADAEEASEEDDDGPEDPLTHDFLLYNPKEPALWLSSYGHEWSVSRRSRVMPEGDPFSGAPGRELTTHDGRKWKLVEHTETVIRYVDGALPWCAQVGDRSVRAEYSAVGAGARGAFYEIERSARGEIEIAEGHRVDEHAVLAAVHGHLKVAPKVETVPRKKVEGRPTLRAVSIGMILFGLLGLATALYYSEGATTAVSRTRLTGEKGTVGPIVTTKANAILEVTVDQNFRRDGWTYLEAEVDTLQGDYLYSFGGDLWSESGRDSDGPWHEEDNEFSIDLTIPKPGSYNLVFTGENSAHPKDVPNAVVQAAVARGASIADPGYDALVTVKRKSGSGIPFLELGLVELLLGIFLFFVASPKARSGVASFAEEMLED